MRKGTAKGARQLTGTVGRLAGVLAVNEIIRARRFLPAVLFTPFSAAHRAA